MHRIILISRPQYYYFINHSIPNTHRHTHIYNTPKQVYPSINKHPIILACARTHTTAPPLYTRNNETSTRRYNSRGSRAPEARSSRGEVRRRSKSPSLSLSFSHSPRDRQRPPAAASLGIRAQVASSAKEKGERYKGSHA